MDTVERALEPASQELDAISRRMEMLSNQSYLQFQAIMLSIETFRAEMRAHFFALRTGKEVERVGPLTKR